MTAVSEALVHVRLTTLLLCLRAFLFHCTWPQPGHAQRLGPPQVVIPLKVTGTHTGLRPPHWLSYSLRFEGKRHVVHIKVQKDLLARYMPVFSYSDQGALLEDHPFVQDDCYYHGYVEGVPESLAVLSTCLGGLRGTFQISDIIYEIEPKRLSTTFEHLVYRVESETFPPMRCGLSDEELARQLMLHESNNVTLMQSGYEGWWTHRRFIELAVVVDNQRYRYKQRNITEVQTEVILVINHVGSFYKSLDIAIILMGIEIWTERNFIQTSTIQDALGEFATWKVANLNKRLPHKTAFIFIKESYGATVGLAYVATICQSHYNCGVGSFMDDVLPDFALTVSHEMGHNLGMKHDNTTCVCGSEHCIMDSIKSKSTRFSNCSYAAFLATTGKSGCLNISPNTDKIFRLQRCGNSVVEEGEQCDCGSVTSCAKDPCCQSDCTLKPGAACAFGLCCKNCQIRPSGTLCRKKENECDLPEWCNGTSHLCPEDVYVQGGFPCKHGGHCYEKRCNNHEEQCKRIFGQKAKSANRSCYREVNTRGDRFGHCGFNGTKYRRCKTADVLCGRVQCEGVTEIPVLSDHSTVVWTHVNGVTCWGTDYHFGMTIPDIGEVKDGTACGVMQICVKRKCVPVSRLKNTCSKETCNMNGVCNNRHHCHCDPGWGPPNCLERGHGGSVDSGPAFRSNKDKKWKYLLSSLLPLFLMLLLALSIFVIYRKKRRKEKDIPTSPKKIDTKVKLQNTAKPNKEKQTQKGKKMMVHK